MERTLNAIMEFDHVIKVTEDGTISDEGTKGLYAPDLYRAVDEDGQSIYADDSDLYKQAKDSGWELLRGFTGQYSYNGPVMHPSEYVGGGLERHIRETPGYYVVVLVNVLSNVEESDYDEEPAGWAIAYRPLAD